jgi:hypothetical protein
VINIEEKNTGPQCVKLYTLLIHKDTRSTKHHKEENAIGLDPHYAKKQDEYRKQHWTGILRDTERVDQTQCGEEQQRKK